MFAQVAAITFESNQYFIKKKHLEELISEYLENVPPHGGEQDGELVLKAIIEQHGIFTERARNDYSFSHLTFQEYFTAKYIVDNARKGILKRLVDHCSEKRWREIFLLMSSLLDDASELIHTFRKAVDEFISKDAKVIKVLARAASKSDLCNTDRLDYREAYLRIGFYGVKFVNHELSSDLGIARSSAFKESPPTNPQNPEIKLDFILYYQLRSETDPDALARYKTKAAAIATELGLTSLAKDLNNLNHPTSVPYKKPIK